MMDESAQHTPDPEPEPVTPTRVSLAELAKVSSPVMQRLESFEDRVMRAQATRPTTPAGLPRGFAWRPHDTGKLGRAAARRLRQQARLAERRAKEQARD